MKRKKICVIGLGNFGFHVARALFEGGHEVVAIDVRQDRVQLVQDHASYTLIADAANKEFLQGQGIHEMDAVVVSTGERSHLSTLITLFLKELKTKRILVKARNEDHGRIISKVGATDVIYPEKDMAEKIARNLASPNILEFIPMGEEYFITEAAPPKKYLGKTLADLDLRRKFGVTVIAIKDVLTDEFTLLPPADKTIKDSDLLIFIGKEEDMSKALGEGG